MQIQLKQPDIEAAISTWIKDQGMNLGVAEVQFIMGRKGSGLSANVTLGKQSMAAVMRDASNEVADPSTAAPDTTAADATEDKPSPRDTKADKPDKKKAGKKQAEKTDHPAPDPSAEAEAQAAEEQISSAENFVNGADPVETAHDDPTEAIDPEIDGDGVADGVADPIPQKPTEKAPASAKSLFS